MKFLNAFSALLVLLLALSALGSAAGPVPGQLAAAAQSPSQAHLSPVLASPTGAPAVTVANVDDSRPDTMQRLWIGSICAVIAASAFDAASSWGKREANPLLASSNGNFGVRGLGIKAGIAAAVITPQLLLRKHKQLRTPFTIANFADAAVFTGTAIHNLGISRPAN